MRSFERHGPRPRLYDRLESTSRFDCSSQDSSSPPMTVVLASARPIAGHGNRRRPNEKRTAAAYVIEQYLPGMGAKQPPVNQRRKYRDKCDEPGCDEDGKLHANQVVAQPVRQLDEQLQTA